MIYYIEGIFDELGYNWKRIIFLITKMRFIIIPRLGNVIDLVSCQTFNNSLCVLFLILTCLCFLPRLLLIVIRSSLLIINNGPALIDVFSLPLMSWQLNYFLSSRSVQCMITSSVGCGLIPAQLWLPVNISEPVMFGSSLVTCRPPLSRHSARGTIIRAGQYVGIIYAVLSSLSGHYYCY